jgi:dTDP-4-amino-4,6-dideoxygalactose transaminase
MNEQALEFQALRLVEADLLQQTGGDSILWCGRAATALRWAYQLAIAMAPHISHPEVILPAISCATPANTARMAGLKPRFADVDLSTGLVTLESIQARCTEHTCAVVVIHLFGATAELNVIADWCRSKQIILIEDAAQALGAVLPDGRAVGSAGDMTVYSFNRTKILECGGGALLVRSSALAGYVDDIIRQYAPPLEQDQAISAQLSLSYRNLHHGLVTLLRYRAVPQVADVFLPIASAYDSLYMRAMQHPEHLARAWDRLSDILELRYRHATLYANALAGGPWRLLNGWRESGVCWRYALLVDFPEQLVAFSEAVRHDGFHVSNLYWPVNQFFYPDDACPNADAFARAIVNLWVDDSINSDIIEHNVESLWKHAERYAQ